MQDSAIHLDDSRNPDGMTPALLHRVRAALRPDTRSMTTQEWRHLVYLHWPAAPEALRPLLPPGLQLDLHRGRAWVSVVPHIAAAHHHTGSAQHDGDYAAIHVRTYVHAGGVPGIWYLSIDASSRLAVATGRLVTGLPFLFSQIRDTSDGSDIEYESVRQSGHHASHRVEASIGQPTGLYMAGTLEHFLLERYAIYGKHLGQLWRVRLHHPPLIARELKRVEVEDELISAAGLPGYAYPPPVSHYVAGVRIDFFAPHKIQPDVQI